VISSKESSQETPNFETKPEISLFSAFEEKKEAEKPV
jgi:hypothetical protein